MGRSGFSTILLYSLSNAIFLLTSGGSIFASTDSHGIGVDFIAPVMILRHECSVVSIFFACVLCDQTGLQYSAVEYTNAMADVLSVEAEDPQSEPARRWMMLHRLFNFS